MSMTSQSLKAFFAIYCFACSVAVVTTFADPDAGNVNKDPFDPEGPECGGCDNPCETIGPNVKLPNGNQGNTGSSGAGLRAPSDQPSDAYEGGGYQNRDDGTFSLETPDISIPNEELSTSGPLTCVGYPLATSMHRVVAEPELLEPGIEQKFTVRNEKGDYVTYERETGATVCPPAAGSHSDSRLEMLDAQGQRTTLTPVACRYFPGDGSHIDYPAESNSAPTTHVGRTGRDLSTSRLEFLTDQASGAYDQIKLEGGLVDFELVDDFSYKIRFYKETDAGVKTGGEYQPTGAPYREILTEFPARNYNAYDWMRTIETHGQYEQITEFRYVPAAERWAETKGITRQPDGSFDNGTLTEDFIVNSDTISRTNPDTNTIQAIKERIIVKETRDSEGLLLSRDSERQLYFPWGAWAVVEEVKDVDGFALTTTHDYYEDPSDSDAFGEHEQTLNPDGSWIRYSYDSEGRVISEVRPWLDSPVGALADQAMERVYDYTPVDSNDTSDTYDERARTTIEKVLGVETSRTYNAYYNDPTTGEYTEVVERTTVQGAAYGDSTNLRSTTEYYASTEAAALSGRIRAYTSEDGSIESHTYSEPDNLGTLIETIDLVASSGPVAYKSKRVKKTFDPNGNQTRSEYYIYDGNTWESFRTIETDFSDEITSEGAQLVERRVDGRVVLFQTWNGPLVATRKDRTGIEYIYGYDALDRLDLEIKRGANGAEDVFTVHEREEGENGCGCDDNVKLKRMAGGITLISEQKTDSAGRRSEMIDENGYSTTYSYVDDRRITTVTWPSGATRITENYLDGRTKSVTGTGVVSQYYTYGLNADGSTWTRVDTADASYAGVQDISAAVGLRYQKSTIDVAGRMSREESPSYDGGVFERTYEYNNLGLLWKQTETGRARTYIFEYDGLANLIRSGLDMDGDAALVAFIDNETTRNDRITDSDRFMEQDASGDWFEIRTTTVYPDEDSAASVEVSRSAYRMSNFPLTGPDGALASETITTDLHGNETVQTVYVDRATKTMKRILDTPNSDIDVITTTVNGLLATQNSSTVAANVIYGYDAVERRTTIKDPRHAQATSIEYYTDSMQVFTQTDADGNTTEFTYYPQGVAGAGQVQTVTDPLLQKSYREYDLLGRLSRTWGETDYPQEYSYTTYGELNTLTTWRDSDNSLDFSANTWPSGTSSEVGDTTTWIYQPSTGLLTRKEYADTNGTDYTYTAANQLYVRTWARDGGLDTTYSYDPDTGELSNINYEAADTADITYTYDRLGRLDTVTDVTGTREFDYDPATLQLDTETLVGTYYDGHILKRKYENGAETHGNGLPGRNKGYELLTGGQSSISAATYVYETTGRLQSVSNGTDTFTYGYEPNSNLLASLTAPQHTVIYDYEDNRDLMTVVDNQISGTSLSKFSYTYDELYRRDDRTQTGTAFSGLAIDNSTDDFSYNSRSEVTGSSNSADTTSNAYNSLYYYDKIGNRKRHEEGDPLVAFDVTDVNGVNQYSANELNQYSSVGGVSYDYDDDGNLETDGTWTYTWNNENRLANASNSGSSESIDFEYDYMGRLVKKDDGTNVKVYIYDGWNRIATFEEDSSSVLIHSSSNLWGLDLSGSMQGAGGVGGLLKEGDLYALYDANGNIMQKLDGVGSVEMNVDYDPFGNIIRGTLEGEYGFSTKPLIDGIQMYYYGFRYYDPGTGRWPSRDPIGERGGLNLFSFVYNSPISWIDPLGLCREIRGIPLDDIMEQAQKVFELGKNGNEHAFENHKNADGTITTIGPYTNDKGGEVRPIKPGVDRDPLVKIADDVGDPGFPDVSVHNHTNDGDGYGPGSVVKPREDIYDSEHVPGGFSGNDIGSLNNFGSDGVVVTKDGDVYHYDPTTGKVDDLGNLDDYEPDGGECCEE